LTEKNEMREGGGEKPFCPITNMLGEITMRKNSLRLSVVAVIAALSLLTLGACSTKSKETLPATGDKADAGSSGGASGGSDASSGSGVSGGAGGVTAEERTQQGQRDASYTEDSQLKDVNFDFDKSDIRPDARDLLKKNAEWMKANPKSKVQIEGHCDERGTNEYNLALGERRANAVKKYLSSLGVEADRLYTISYGEELPLDPGHNEEAWGKNRRAHFLVTK
jgi:peptidoglycan-associated lipoprotein